MSSLHHTYLGTEAASLHHYDIPHTGGAAVGTALGVAGVVASAVKLAAPTAVMTFDVAYQLLGLASAVCITLINLYYWRELKRAQTAKAIADLTHAASVDSTASYQRGVDHERAGSP